MKKVTGRLTEEETEAILSCIECSSREESRHSSPHLDLRPKVTG